MKGRLRPWIPELAVALALLPLPWIAPALAGQVKDILVFSVLALGLNVVVGYTGLLHLGIAAFFGIGAYAAGILSVEQYPFRLGVWTALPVAALVAALAGVVLAAPALRLRGDYLALVTLGFGEVVKFAIKNLEGITNGSKSLNPLPDPAFFGVSVDWARRGWFFLALAVAAAVMVLLRNLERSKIGRAWMAVREDELAASCMGLNAARIKLSAFALGSGLAGLAGALYAFSHDGTQGPDSYTFNRSINVLCFLIIGGMGSLRGAVVGTFVLMGYDNILTPILDGWVQDVSRYKFSDIKLIVFGLALVLMMRFRPEGLLPPRRAEARP